MSAFVMNHDRIDRIVTWLEQKTFNEDWDVLEVLRRHGRSPDNTCWLSKWSNELGSNLHKMNVDAVNACYGSRDEAEPYHFVRRRVAEVQVFKHAECLLYQCSEGKVVETPLYKFLEDLVTVLAGRVARQHPEYEACSWD